MLFAAALVLELARESLTGTHCRYREYVDGLPTDTYVVKPCQSPLPAPRGEGQGEGLRSFNGRIIRRELTNHYLHDYDATTGELLRTIPFFYRAKPARVFDPNPVVTLNDPTLQDHNDAASAVPASAYKDVQIDLDGPNVKLVDRQPRIVPPPDPSSSLLFDREMDGFEDVNAYFHIDGNQRYLQSLGYRGLRQIVPYAIEVDAHATNGSDDSFFLPSGTEIGKGTLLYGEGGTDDAEDADLLVHEYGHAILEWIAPGTFGGAFSSESRALGEGFGDYWAYSAHVAARVASGRDPFCFADWDARCWEDAASEQCGYPVGSDCLRRLDSTKTMADYEQSDVAGVEHRNGMIWSSALREIHQQLGKQIADTIVIESAFDAPPSPTFAGMAQQMIAADRLLYLGAHVPAICAAMLSRDILTTCEFTPRGERTEFQSFNAGVPIPENDPNGIFSTLRIDDPRLIEQIFVRVDIAHPARGDLRIELIAPNGTTVRLHDISISRTPDIHETFGLTVAPVEPLNVLTGDSAAGVWQLHIIDLRRRDAGTLLSWGLVIQFAGDAPLTERPRDAHAQMIPVVGHVYGASEEVYVSDLRVANPSSSPRTATLIFTRSGEDGRAHFSAVKAVLDAGQTMAWDDVVDSAFHTAGTGTLEVLGDVIVMSRTYIATANGTLGQQVPPNLDTTALDGPPLLVAPLPVARSTRSNIGIAESGGADGVVRVNGIDVTIAAYSQVQFPLVAERAEIRVVQGNARVSAYVSQIDNVSRDAMFVAAKSGSFAAALHMAPVTDHAGWKSDVWSFDGTPVEGTLFGSASFGALRTTALTGSRVARDGISQFVPFMDADGPAEQQLLFVETSPEYRTNIGIVSDERVVAEVIVYDSGGTPLESRIVVVTDGVTQGRVLTNVIHGRAVVRFGEGKGRAYLSLIDNRTADATFVAGQ